MPQRWRLWGEYMVSGPSSASCLVQTDVKFLFPPSFWSPTIRWLTFLKQSGLFWIFPHMVCSSLLRRDSNLWVYWDFYRKKLGQIRRQRTSKNGHLQGFQHCLNIFLKWTRKSEKDPHSLPARGCFWFFIESEAWQSPMVVYVWRTSPVWILMRWRCCYFCSLTSQFGLV